jgi:hypothetical protein
LAALLAVVVLSACQATVRVTVQARPSGSGTVTVALVLDHQAAARLGDLATQLRVDDLEHQGWRLQPAVTAADGTVTASLVHPFATPAEGQALLDQLKPLTLKLDRSHGLTSTHVGLSGTVDLTGGVDAFGDSALASALGVASLSGAMADLQRNGAALPALSAQVVAELPARPGDLKGNPTVTGHQAAWTIGLGSRTTIAATSSSPDRRAEILTALALLLVLAAVAVVVEGRRRGRRDAG